MLKRRTKTEIREVRRTKKGDVPFSMLSEITSILVFQLSFSLLPHYPGGKTTGFHTWGKRFKVNFFKRKTSLQIFKPGRQNRPHS